MRARVFPTEVQAFPELAFAALKARDEAAFSAWMVMRTWDSQEQKGAGYLPKTMGKLLIAEALGVGRRQLLRILASGNGRYWSLVNPVDIRLHSAVRVAKSEGVDCVSRPHIIRTDHLRGAANRRSSLIATAYRTDELGVPITRRLIRERTGVAAQTQRRLDRQFGDSQTATPVFACFGRQVSQFYADSVAEMGH